MDQKKRTLKRLGIAGVATAMTTIGAPALAGAAPLAASAHADTSSNPVPGAPTNLKATDAGAGKITLSWTAPSSGSVSGYNVYEGSAAGKESSRPANGEVLVRGTTDTVTVNTDGTYYFEVAAVNAAGQGQVSNEASATAAAVSPSVPLTVTATPSAGAVTVEWKAPATGDTPEYYTVNYGTSASALTQSVEVKPTTGIAPPTMSYINGLTDGTTYYFDVTATNAAGTSGASSTVSATPKTGLVPPPPIVNAPAAGNGTITLSWNEPNAASNSVTGYNVYEGTTAGGESTTPVNGTVPITNTSTTVSVANGSTEYFTVKAINSVGMSAASAEVNATASAGANPVPTPPQFLVANPLDGAVKLTWKAPASSGNSKVDHYVVLEGSSSATVTNPVNVSGTKTDITTSTSAIVTGLGTATGLANGTKYYFAVEAVNSAEANGYTPLHSGLSNVANATPGGNSVPTAPQGLTLSTTPATSGTANQLTWSAPVYAGTGTSKYDVYRNGTLIAQTSGLSFTDSTKATGTVTGYTAPTPGTKYSYKVTAFNNFGASAADGPVSITTGLVTPAAPTLESSSVTANGQVDLTWAAPSDQGAGKLIYEVLRNGTPLASFAGSTAGTAEPLPTVSSKPATFTVEAQSTTASTQATVLGTSVPSNGLNVTPIATPNKPTGLSASASGPTSVKLTWGAPTGAAAPTNYVIWQGTQSGAEVPVATIGSSTSFTATGLTSGTKYYFEVQAENASATSGKTSGPSNEASATPVVSTTSAPGAPTALVASADGLLVNLGWTAPSSSGGSPLMNYEVYERPVASGANPTLIGSTSGTATSAVLDNLEGSFSSFFGTTVPLDLYVKSVNSSGQTSGLSAPVQITPSRLTAPGTPGTPVVQSEGAGKVLVAWSPPANDGGSTIKGYFVTAHLLGGKGKTIRTAGLSTEATVSGLAAGRYYFTVVAINGVGGGTPSAPSAILSVTSSGPKVHVYVTPPKMISKAGVTTIRVTTSRPGVQVHLFDEAFGTSHFFQKKIMTTTAQSNGTGVAIFKVGIARTNRFFVVADGVKSNVVVARVK